MPEEIRETTSGGITTAASTLPEETFRTAAARVGTRTASTSLKSSFAYRWTLTLRPASCTD